MALPFVVSQRGGRSEIIKEEFEKRLLMRHQARHFLYTLAPV
jgi:hypothetical protein